MDTTAAENAGVRLQGHQGRKQLLQNRPTTIVKMSGILHFVSDAKSCKTASVTRNRLTSVTKPEAVP